MMENLLDRIESFSRLICSIGNEKDTFEEIDRYFKTWPVNNNGMSGRVWILVGKDSDNNYCSLMVAQSEDIESEIIVDVGYMFNLEYKKQKKAAQKWDFDKEIKYNLDIIRSPQEAKINSNDNTYLFPKGSSKIRSQYLYRYLYKKYLELKLYEVDIDLYLHGDVTMSSLNPNLSMVYEFGKDYYAESKLAVETGSLFWNYYKSGVGKRSYYYFRNQQK